MPDPVLLHVCSSAKKGIVKHEVPFVSVRMDYGIEGDAHAGDWHRQVSLLAHADIESMRAKGLTLRPGAFGENLVIDGVITDELGIGTQLEIGPVLLELTQIGKVCHTRCAIYYTTGDCIMPRTGLFARVLKGGELSAGMAVRIVRTVSRETIQCAVITVSDRCANGITHDTAGPAVAGLLREDMRANVVWTRTVPDEPDQIVTAMKDFAERRVDLVLTVGGTGIGPRDVTPEATRSVIERELPGIAEAMRAASMLKTPHAMFSRSVAGVLRETLILNLPGSERAATENLLSVIGALPHAVCMLRNQPVHTEDDAKRLIRIAEEGSHDTQLY